MFAELSDSALITAMASALPKELEPSAESPESSSVAYPFTIGTESRSRETNTLTIHFKSRANESSYFV